MGKAAYYGDAYTRDGIVPETDRTPAVKFQYRPLTVAGRRRWQAQIRSAGGDASKVDEIAATMLGAQLVSWDLEKPMPGAGPDGPMCQVDFKDKGEVERLDPFILDHIFSSLIGSPTPVEQTKN